MKHIHYLLIPLFVGVLTLGIIFLHNGVLNVQTDTVVYISQINYYQGESQMDDQSRLRSFKPFYGVVGAMFSNIMTEEQSLLLINILFYFGLIVSSFYLFRELGFQDRFAAIGSSWVATGYPVLKYGLALLTDISGWFFAGATIVLFLTGLRKQNSWLLILSSIVAFVGSLCKETGLLGLGFSGLYLSIHFLFSRKKEHILNLLKISLPFIMLEAMFLFTLFQKSGSQTSFVDWFLFNKNTIGYDLHTWFYFFFTEASTFSLLFVYVAYGVWMFMNKKVTLSKEKTILGLSLLIATLPVLIWPVFLTRVLYIGYLIVVPAALGSLLLWSQYNKENIKTLYVLSLLPVLSSLGLFFLASGGSLFSLLDHF